MFLKMLAILMRIWEGFTPASVISGSYVGQQYVSRSVAESRSRCVNMWACRVRKCEMLH